MYVLNIASDSGTIGNFTPEMNLFKIAIFYISASFLGDLLNEHNGESRTSNFDAFVQQAHQNRSNVMYFDHIYH